MQAISQDMLRTEIDREIRYKQNTAEHQSGQGKLDTLPEEAQNNKSELNNTTISS